MLLKCREYKELKRKVAKLLLWLYSLSFWLVWGVRWGILIKAGMWWGAACWIWLTPWEKVITWGWACCLMRAFLKNRLERDVCVSWDDEQVWRTSVLCQAAPRWGMRMGIGTGILLPVKWFWVMLQMLLCPCCHPGPKQRWEVGREEQKDSSKSSSSLCFIKPLTPPLAWNRDEIAMR